jgi:hypothetical protein
MLATLEPELILAQCLGVVSLLSESQAESEAGELLFGDDGHLVRSTRWPKVRWSVGRGRPILVEREVGLRT